MNDELSKKNEILMEMVKKRDAAFANMNAKDYKVFESVVLPYKENSEEPDDAYLESLGFKNYYTDMEQSNKANILTKMAVELKEAREIKKQFEAQQKAAQQQKSTPPPSQQQKPLASKPHVFDQYAPVQDTRGVKRGRDDSSSSSAYSSQYTNNTHAPSEIPVGASRFRDDYDEDTETPEAKYQRISEDIIKAINLHPKMSMSGGYGATTGYKL